MTLFIKIGELDVDYCNTINFHTYLKLLTEKPNYTNRFVQGAIKVFQNTLTDRDCVEKDVNLVVDVFNNQNKKIENTIPKKIRLEKNEIVSEDSSGQGSINEDIDDPIICHLRDIHRFWFENSNYNPKINSYFRKLVPRDVERFSSTYEWQLFGGADDGNLILVTIPICIVDDAHNLLITKSYASYLNLKEKLLSSYVHKDFDIDIPHKSLVVSKSYLTENLSHKLKKWFESDYNSQKRQFKSLVDIEKYSLLYSHLKLKYASYFIQIWPENTDPLKFVYEDIAIATYILLIWEEERLLSNSPKKQSFIDLGCGNGLLVHILSSEGHPGKGVDIVKRKIWSCYGENTILEESPIHPHKLKVVEDWIIGNHTDELTPWIPIIAARSSYYTNYFVLPCCFYDFTKKFDKYLNSGSKYQEYLQYIVDIGQDCGFQVEEDILKIPSTKRICSIGRCKISNVEDQNDIDHLVKRILNSRSCCIELDEDGESSGFIPRVVSNDPKNCTQIDHQVKKKIVDTIIKRLLSKENIGFMGEDNLTSSGNKWSEWNAGDCIPISEAAKLFSNELIHKLKTQSGGLQCLLRNNQNIFKVASGMVGMRDFRKSEELHWGKKKTDPKKITCKTADCWFYKCHPQGCVLPSEKCRYSHGDMDINDSERRKEEHMEGS